MWSGAFVSNIGDTVFREGVLLLDALSFLMNEFVVLYF